MSYAVNPFQNLELKIPEVMRAEVERFCQTRPSGGAKPSPDDSPFEREVDLWFLAVCLGARKHTHARMPATKYHRFITGEMLSRDPYRVELLELLAIALKNDPWILERPDEIMNLANELASSGLPGLLDMLKTGSSKPIWNLTDNLIELLSESSHG